MDDNMIKCPKCGHDNASSSVECDNCGVTLSLVLGNTQKTKKPPKPPAPPSETPPPEIEGDLKNCPKCGHEVAESSTECIKCGIIFSKYFVVQERKLRETLSDLDRSVLEEAPEDEENQEAAAEKEKVLAELEKAEAERRRIEEQEKKDAERREAEKEEETLKEAEEAAKAESEELKAAEKEKEAPPVEKPAEKAPAPSADKENMQRIVKLDPGAVSEKAVDSARANYDGAKKNVEYATSQLNLARRNLEKTVLLAPFDGVIAERHVDRFQEVKRGQKVFDVYI